MTKVDVRDLIGGAILIVLGLFVALYAANHYDVGQPDRMGPGFYPVALGWVFAGLGVIIVALSFRRTRHVLVPPPFRLRALIAVAAAILAFSFLLERLGLIPATLALILLASFAGSEFRLRRAIVLSVCLSILAWLLFTVGLQMNLPAFEH